MAKKDTGFITTGERVRNYVGIAFIVSLILHMLASPFFPNLNKHRSDDTVEKVSVTKKIKVKVPTPPPPSPTPPPTPTPPPQRTPPPQQKVAPQPKLKVNLVKTHNAGTTNQSENTVSQPKTGSEQGNPAGTSTGPPSNATPAPTAKPACANPNQDATVTTAMQPEYPQSAQDQGLGPVTVLVQVTVGPSGNLVDAKVYKSSNNMAVDNAAIRAARQSQYAPKLINCAPTTGDYIFRADFQPD